MRACLLLAVLVLAGCGTTPQPDYFLLTAQAEPAAGAAPGTAGAALRLGLAELGLAEYLRRSELVSLEADNRIRVDPYRRWAEPLEDGIRRTLLLNLGALLGSDGVRAMPWPRDWSPDWLLRCYLARLDVTAERIELVAVWSLQDGARQRPAEEHTSRLSRPRSSAAPDRMAADVSALLLELSEHFASSIRERSAPRS